MRSLRSTTAVILTLSMAAAGPAFPQGQGQGNANGLAKQAASDLGLELCGDGVSPPCISEDALLVVQDDALAGTLDVCMGDNLPCANDEGLVEIDPESELAAQVVAEMEMTTEADTASGDAMNSGTADQSADVVAVDEGEGNAEAEAEGSTIEEDTTAETELAPSAEAEAEAEATAEADASVDEQAAETEELADALADESEAEAEADVTAEAEAPAETAAEAETTAEAEASVEEQAAETQELADALAEEAQAEGEAEVTAEAEAEAEAEATAEVETNEAPTEETAEAEVVTDDTPEQPEETVFVEEAPAAAAASAEGEASAEAEVETEEVTEETSRSSSEDFTTTVTGEASAQARTADGDDDGLSNFEKALLIGLGAVAVGSVLDNGDEVVSNSGDRLVLQDESGNLRVLKNDDALLRQPGSQVQTETFNDGSTRTTVVREDGTRIITIRDANGRVLRRVREFENGDRVVLFDDTEVAEPVDISRLPEPQQRQITVDTNDEDALRLALADAQSSDVGRDFSLNQVRQIRQVRELAPELNLEAITFATGSAAIQPNQAEELATLGRAMSRIIEERPGEVFLIEGHTDAVGSATYNLALSDRRAETVALALTEYFDVPPENMVTQGYGESALKVQTLDAERANRRATIRRITPLLRQAALDR